ncbi:twin-arginine translocase subunit TatB [Jiella sp. MQZ13P-4]|uniref:Sec-independent protein translocase protein TatB n=1 Tax=Jiella sonneratiae TaxID=2816856 RepID=A0ABS3IXT8_9HYPH|nr:Sec-independent protein translocase protein TatB [Jiella sonneratiae]MBO0902206.1 twin-arginine translocase subunit TatB [Jiella sonneratiae]
MFDLGWSELLVIAVVLVVVVGPKDLPGMLRTFGRVTRQLRSMAGDFRRQFDEALKEAELDDVRKGIDDVRSLDPRRSIRDAMSPMKAIGDEIRSSLNSATAAPEPRVPSPADKPVPEGEPAKTGAVDEGAAAAEASHDGGRTDGPVSEAGARQRSEAEADGAEKTPEKARDVA